MNIKDIATEIPISSSTNELVKNIFGMDPNLVSFDSPKHPLLSSASSSSSSWFKPKYVKYLSMFGIIYVFTDPLISQIPKTLICTTLRINARFIYAFFALLLLFIIEFMNKSFANKEELQLEEEDM